MYSTQWTNEFYCSARGDSAEEWLDQPKTRRAKLPYPPIKILYPSAKTVKESVLGERVRVHVCLVNTRLTKLLFLFRAVARCSADGINGKGGSFPETSSMTREVGEGGC